MAKNLLNRKKNKTNKRELFEDLLSKPKKAVKAKHPVYATYILRTEALYSLKDLISFLNRRYNADFHSLELIDDRRAEFEEKFKIFLSACSHVYEEEVLIPRDACIEFFSLIDHFVSIEPKTDLSAFFDATSKEETDISSYLPLVEPTVFLSREWIDPEEVSREKHLQYIKKRPFPRWHNYAGDIIDQLNNSRKSFLFTHQENANFKGISRISAALQSNRYAHFSEFSKDIQQMLQGVLQKVKQGRKNEKNVIFCQSLKERIDKTMEKLKQQGKI